MGFEHYTIIGHCIVVPIHEFESDFEDYNRGDYGIIVYHDDDNAYLFDTGCIETGGHIENKNVYEVSNDVPYDSLKEFVRLYYQESKIRFLAFSYWG